VTFHDQLADIPLFCGEFFHDLFQITLQEDVVGNRDYLRSHQDGFQCLCCEKAAIGKMKVPLGNVDAAAIQNMTEECFRRRISVRRVILDGVVDLQPEFLLDVITVHLKAGMDFYDGGCDCVDGFLDVPVGIQVFEGEIFFSHFDSPTGWIFLCPLHRAGVISTFSGELQQKTAGLFRKPFFEEEENEKFHESISGKNGKWIFFVLRSAF
jgi:hypothetical protein